MPVGEASSLPYSRRQEALGEYGLNSRKHTRLGIEVAYPYSDLTESTLKRSIARFMPKSVFERRNCARQGKASEENEAVYEYGDLTESTL